MERTAYLLTAWKLGRYYRTYEPTVEEEVGRRPAHGRVHPRPRRCCGVGRPGRRPAFVVEDGRYVSARWPGDAYLLAKRLIAQLEVAAARPVG